MNISLHWLPHLTSLCLRMPRLSTLVPPLFHFIAVQTVPKWNFFLCPTVILSYSQSSHYFSMCPFKIESSRRKEVLCTPAPSLCSWETSPLNIVSNAHTNSHGTGSRGHRTRPDNPQREEKSPKKQGSKSEILSTSQTPLRQIFPQLSFLLNLPLPQGKVRPQAAGFVLFAILTVWSILTG